MKKMSVILLALAMLLGYGVAHASATKVAVLDREAAVLSTKAAKSAQDRLFAELKPQRDKVEKLRIDLDAINNKLTKEASTLPEASKRSLREQGEAKAKEFSTLMKQVQDRSQQEQQALLKNLLPNLEKILEAMRKSGEFDLLIDRRSVVYAGPDIDITAKVVQRLDAVVK